MRVKRAHDKYAPVMTDDKWGAEERKSYTYTPAPPVEWRCTNPWVNWQLKAHLKGWN